MLRNTEYYFAHMWALRWPAAQRRLSLCRQEETPQTRSKSLQGRKMSDKDTMSVCEEEGAVCRWQKYECVHLCILVSRVLILRTCTQRGADREEVKYKSMKTKHTLLLLSSSAPCIPQITSGVITLYGVVSDFFIYSMQKQNLNTVSRIKIKESDKDDLTRVYVLF